MSHQEAPVGPNFTLRRAPLVDLAWLDSPPARLPLVQTSASTFFGRATPVVSLPRGPNFLCIIAPCHTMTVI